MPLQSWSKKVREQDFSLPWAFQIGRDPASTTAGQVTVYALESGNTTEILNSSITSTTEDITTLFPSDPESISGPGQLIRGIHAFGIPTADSGAFGINESYGIRLENTGTTNVTVLNCLRSFNKRYPTEVPDTSSVEGLGLSAQDEIDYTTSVAASQVVGSPLNLLDAAVTAVIDRVPAPTALVTAFNSLSSTSTDTEVQAVIGSSDFLSYYGNQLPVASVPAVMYLWQGTKENPTRVSLPLVLAPGETLTLGLTEDIAAYAYHPFLITL